MLGETEAYSQRNPGEVFRQYLRYMLTRIDATLRNLNDPSKSKIAYHRAADLSTDLSHLEQGLADAKCGHLSDADVRPLRHMVDTFGFRTVSLDIRENTTVVNSVLAEIWQALHQKTHIDVPKILRTMIARVILLNTILKSLNNIRPDNSKPTVM